MTRRSVARVPLLRRRASQLLFSSRYAGDEVRDLLRRVGELGPVAAFGGVLRDLCLAPPSAFHSDLDLVVCSETASSLAGVLRNAGGKRNRYGGFRLSRGRWVLDVWALRDTWAIREGLVTEPSFAGLVNTTFFNWDAIVFELNTKQLYYGKRYYEDLESNLLEINLEPNANPAGNVIRALDFAMKRRARLGPLLAGYVHQFVSTQLTTPTVRRRPDYQSYFRQPAVNTVLRQLRVHLRASPELPFTPAVALTSDDAGAHSASNARR